MPFKSSKMDGTTNPKPKTSKPRSLPPPGEAFGANKDTSKTKAKAKPATKKVPTLKKTPAKLKVAAKKSDEGGRVDAGNGVTKPAPAKKGRPAKPKPMSVYRSVLSESNSIGIFFGASKKKREPESVLMRHTATSQRIRDDMDKRNLVRKPGMQQQIAKPAKNGSDEAFRVMDLPNELRMMVWRNAVINQHVFVWPEKHTGHEQPDLAMTCRLVREEVLPIFYAENIFAINLSPENEPSYQKWDEAAKGKKKVVLNGGIPVVAEWAAALTATEKRLSWFSMVRKWVFSYSPRVQRDVITNRLVKAKDEKGIVVAVNFSKRLQGGLFWDAGVEIHRFALCLLPSYEEYGACKVHTVPGWLNDPVISITAAAKGGNIDEKMITGLANEIRRNVVRLEELRCESVLQRAEPYCDR